VVGERHMALHLPVGNCCDMTGAIRVATAMMPEVRLIDCYEGPDLDISYVRTKHNGGLKWRAVKVDQR
jgi:hypothetical protein